MANIDHGGDRVSEGSKAQICALVSQHTAAAMLTVSRTMVQMAKKVKDEAVSELQDAVRTTTELHGAVKFRLLD